MQLSDLLSAGEGNVSMEKQKRVSSILLIVLVLNLIVSAAKIAIGLTTGLQSVLADGYHSLTDGFSNVVGLIGVRIAAKPGDFDHAYGHARYETIASLGIVALLVYLGIDILTESVHALSAPVKKTLDSYQLLILVATLLINILVTTLEYGAGKRLNSSILKSDALHTLSDVYITCGVLFSVVAIRFLNAPPQLDSVVSMIIAVLIFKAAYSIFRSAADELADKIAVEPALVVDVLLSVSEVKGVHKVRSRRSGDFVYLDFHVQCDPDMKLKDAHALMHRLEAILNEKLGASLNATINCVIHAEPVPKG